uniref:Uncharacterized protein n=1 Tax=Siphoviridae sp. ctgn638 TaxID=2827913 RepID=A0A8S5TKR2_9CAUD|nr:MAG TPA: protein of unknown function (DUF1731) [Siphoviridae sp. ctgn638]
MDSKVEFDIRVSPRKFLKIGFKFLYSNRNQNCKALNYRFCMSCGEMLSTKYYHF